MLAQAEPRFNKELKSASRELMLSQEMHRQPDTQKCGESW